MFTLQNPKMKNNPKYALELGPYIESQGDGLFSCSMVRMYRTGPGHQRQEERRLTRSTNRIGAVTFARKYSIPLEDIVYGKAPASETEVKVKSPLKKNVQKNVQKNVPEVGPVQVEFLEGQYVPQAENNVDTEPLENVEATNNVEPAPVDNVQDNVEHYPFVRLRENVNTFTLEFFQVNAPDFMGGTTVIAELTSQEEAGILVQDYVGGFITPIKVTLLKTAAGFKALQKEEMIRKALMKLSHEDIEVLNLKELAEAVTN